MSKEPLAPEQLTKRLRIKAQWLDQPEVNFTYGSRVWCFRRIKDAAVDHREAADRIDSDTALIGELVESLEKVDRIYRANWGRQTEKLADIGPIVADALTRARKRTGGA